MSHRSKSLTPWITNETHGELPPATFDDTRWSDDDPKTDREKHDFCLRRTGMHATFLSPSLYAKAESLRQDMRWYVITKPLPEIVEHRMPTSEVMRAATLTLLDEGLPLGALHNMEFKGPVYVNGSLINTDGGGEYRRGPLEVSKLAPSVKLKWCSACCGFGRWIEGTDRVACEACNGTGDAK